MRKEGILVITAHPDDETFGCGGTIALHTKKGHVCSVLTMICSEKEREAELRDASRIIGVEELVILNEKNMALNSELISKVSDVIVKVKPGMVITHVPWDYHREHRVTFEVVKEALEWSAHTTAYKDPWNVQRLLMMEVNTMIPIPKVIVDISDHFNTKRKAMECYRSQLSKFPEGYYQKFNTAKAELRGAQGGCKYAEAFFEEALTRSSPFFKTKSVGNLFH